MEIVVVKNAGFCFGVSRAVRLTYELIDSGQSSKVVTLGPVIHNEQVVADLESKGAKVVTDIDRIEEGSSVVVRAHGIKPADMEKLLARNVTVIDTTCPDVKRVQKLVEKHYKDGYQIILVGDPNHPEIIGVNGYCDDTAIILDSPDFDIHLLDNINKKVFVIAQTTITKEKWDRITKRILEKFPDAQIKDTICGVTSRRQQETEDLAKEADVMLVIGGKASSNTQKLYEICKKYCPQTYFIETAADLPQLEINKIKKLGITAGASTPDWIIKEVLTKMNELNTENNEMSFQEAMTQQEMISLRQGEIVTGKVIDIKDGEVFVDLGYKSDGIIPLEELTDDPDVKPEQILKVGDEIEVYIEKVNDGDGNVLLSRKKVESIKGWDNIEKAYEDKTILEGKIVEVVKGGVIAVVSGTRVFIPASQVSDRFTKDLSVFLKTPVRLRIIELDKRRKRVVGSQRIVLEEENAQKRENLWATIEVGKRYKGVVKRLADFGAFVDIGGVDGLVHISELSWKKIKHPSEVLKEGDLVEVTVLDFDREKERISLGYRKAEDNPWHNIEEKYPVGKIVKGKVVRLVPFGAFLELEPGVDGLVHISQISNKRIAKPSDVLNIGDVVEAKVIEVNGESQKIGLSIREVNPVPEKHEEKQADSQKEDKPQDAENDVMTEYHEEGTITIGDVIKSQNEDLKK